MVEAGAHAAARDMLDLETITLPSWCRLVVGARPLGKTCVALPAAAADRASTVEAAQHPPTGLATFV